MDTNRSGQNHSDTAIPSSVDLIVSHGLVITMDPTRRMVLDGAVAINDGKIIEVDKSPHILLQYAARTIIDASDFVVMPGLVDAHVHITAEHLVRNPSPDDVGSQWMTDWALPLYGAVTPEEEYAGALLSCLEMIRNGTTTFGEGGTLRDVSACWKSWHKRRTESMDLGLPHWSKGTTVHYRRSAFTNGGCDR